MTPTALLDLLDQDAHERYGIRVRRVNERSILRCMPHPAPFGVGDAEYAIGHDHVFIWTRRLTGPKVAACIHEIGHILFDIQPNRTDWLEEGQWTAWEALTAVRLGCWREWSFQMDDYGVNFTRFKSSWGDLTSHDQYAVLTKGLWDLVADPATSMASKRDVLESDSDPFAFLLQDSPRPDKVAS